MRIPTLQLSGAFSSNGSVPRTRKWATNTYDLILLLGQLVTAVSLCLASTYGNFYLYLLSSAILIAFLLSALVFRPSSLTGFLTVMLSFVVFRYITIVKYAQPLFDDAWSDMRTARFFADTGRVMALPSMPNDTLFQYSLWPFVHLVAITISNVSGIDLFRIFSYFGPIISFPSLIFIYLLTRELFDDDRKATIAALIASVFSITLFWQLQLVRQNLGITIFAAGLYTYVKSRNTGSKDLLLVSLAFFSILPLVHHLTSLVALATLFAAYVLEKSYWKRDVSLGFVLFVSSIAILTWTTLQGVFMIPAVVFRALGVLLGLGGGGKLGSIQSRLSVHFEFYDLLSLLRIFVLAGGAFLGLLFVVRRRIPFGGILSGLFLGSGIFLAVAFVSVEIDERFALLLVLPTAMLVALVAPKRKLSLALLLLIIVLPAPFKLYETFNASPNYVFDSRATVHFEYGEFSKFRAPSALMLARWNGEFNVGLPVLADEYDAQVLQQSFDPSVVYFLGFPNRLIVSDHPQSNVLVFFNTAYTEGRYGEPVQTDLHRLVSSGALIYSDGSQVGYYVPPQGNEATP